MASVKRELADKTCEHCGKTFNRRRYTARLEDARSFLARRFCSIECRALYTAELKKSGKGDGKQTARGAGRRRNKERCEACGSAGALYVYYLDGDPDNDVEWNRQELCATCYGFLHTKRREGVVKAGQRLIVSAAQASVPQERS